MNRQLRLAVSLLIAFTPAAAKSTAAAPDPVTISDAWARATPAHAHMGSIYLSIVSTSGDRLLKASAPHAVSADTQLHQTIEQHDPTGGGDVMSMREVSSIELPAGQKVELKPGGFHVMLIDLKRGLKAGDKVNLTLRFERAGTRKVVADVRER